jgi:hypothetical protein
MSILNYLPTFKVVEMNRSTGLVAGHVISQFPVGTIATKDGDGEFIENGVIVGLTNDLTLENYDATAHSMPFIVFTEELNTFMAGLKYFAVPVEAGSADTYVRAVALYVGDVWTTNNFVGTGAGGAYNDEAFAKVTNGIITLQAVADADTLFAVEESTMPADGSEAVKITYIGKPLVVN